MSGTPEQTRPPADGRAYTQLQGTHTHTLAHTSHCTRMPHVHPAVKHHILTQDRPRSPTHSFRALARQLGGSTTEATVRSWHRHWDGTPQSLMRRTGGGRPRILSRAQVARHVRLPILHANRSARAIHYPDLLPRVVGATGKQPSLRTLRRYGQQQLGARKRRTSKRTARECASTHAITLVLCVDARRQRALTQ
jgi:hypothetical protein